MEPDENDSDSRDGRSDSALSRDFGLTESEFFDIVYQEPFPIGLNRSYPGEYIKRIIVAAASYQLRNKSIDWTMKRYGDRFVPPTKPIIRAKIESFIGYLKQFQEDYMDIQRSRSAEDMTSGGIIFDLYSVRAFDSIEAAAILATNGFFGEVMSVLRHLVEQIAWLVSIRSKTDVDEIIDTRPERCITTAKSLFPKFGAMYGFLSEATHFRYEHHIFHYSDKGSHLAVLTRSFEFSACGFVGMAICAAYLVTTQYNHVNSHSDAPKISLPNEMVELHSEIMSYFEIHGDHPVIRRLLEFQIPIGQYLPL